MAVSLHNALDTRFRKYRDSTSCWSSLTQSEGVPQAFWFDDRQTTEYFSTRELCRFAKHVAILRAYLVEQFNEPSSTGQDD
jgi:hypothetical protein